MRGTSLLDSTPDAEGPTAFPDIESAPSENRAGGLGAGKAGEVQASEWARRLLQNVAVTFRTWGFSWQPTAESCLNQAPKARIVRDLKEAGPDLAGSGVEARKRVAMVTAPALRLAGMSGCRRRCADRQAVRSAWAE
jgi:hypothetical protein